MLITDILKRTSKDNSDYVKLEKALTVTKEVMTYVFYCMLVWSVEKNIKVFLMSFIKRILFL